MLDEDNELNEDNLKGRQPVVMKTTYRMRTTSNEDIQAKIYETRLIMMKSQPNCIAVVLFLIVVVNIVVGVLIFVVVPIGMSGRH